MRGDTKNPVPIVDPERLGLLILAFVRLGYPNADHKLFRHVVAVTPAAAAPLLSV